MPGVEVVDPLGYGWWWQPVGWGLLVLVVGWFVAGEIWIRRSTRPQQPVQQAPPAAGNRAQPDPWAAVRTVYLGKIDELESRFSAGELDNRGLHLELRRVMREFAGVRTGVDTTAYTDQQILMAGGLKRLANPMTRYAAPSFAPSSRMTPETSMEQAREAVRKW